MPQFDSHQYEHSREIKQRFLSTRKHDPTIGATSHPGLFQTANIFGDAFGLVLALGLEAYGLTNLMRIGSIELAAASSLVAVDLLGALLTHFKQGNLCRIRCQQAVTDDPSERARIRHRNRLRDRAIRGLGSLMIAGSAAWKITSFTGIGSLNDTPPAIIGLMALVYLTAAFLHWRCTGFAFAHAWLMLGSVMEERRTLGEDPATAKCGIHGVRTHSFDSRLPLVECTVNGHALVALDDSRFTLRTAGLLFDHDLATLAAKQDGPETRDTVNREGLRAQLIMLDEEPVRPSKTQGTVRTDEDKASEPAIARNGTWQAAMPFTRRVALLISMAAVAGGFSGCGNPPTQNRVVEMKVIVPDAELTEEHKLPEALVDLLAPAKVPATDGKTPAVVPTISLVIAGGGYAPVLIKPQADPGFVARTYGVSAPAARLLASIREQLHALRLVPAAEPAAHESGAEPSAKRLALDKDGKTFAFDPGTAGTHSVKVDNAEVPAFGDPAEMGRMIARAVAAGESKFTVLYAVADLISPPPTKSASAEATAKQPDLQETRPTEDSAKPRIISLNENYNHAALVEHAESQLVIHFNSGSAELSFDAVKAIERLAKKTTATGDATGQWIVIGYSDGKGKMEDNDHLSLDRGLRTAAEMASCGMNVSIVAGAGVTRPAKPNETADGRAVNRRVIIYWKPGKISTAGI